MVGTRKGDPVNDLYREVGALTETTEIYNTGSVGIEVEGVLYTVPLELHKFRAFLLTLSDRDASVIDVFCREIDMMRQSKLMAGSPSGVAGMLYMLKNCRGFIKLSRRYRRKTVGEVVKLFKSDIIREILLSLIPGAYSAIALFLMLGTRMSGNAGYPMGGASELVRRMEEKYKTLGGTIHFNAKVDEILVIGGKALGIRSKGIAYQSDGVVAACDAFNTLKKMLRNRYIHPQLDAMLDGAPLFDPLAIVSFGLDRKLDIPFSTDCQYPEGFEAAPGVMQHAFHLRCFDFDASAAPKDGSSVMAIFNAPLEYWMRLRHQNPAGYKIQKEHLAERVAAMLEMRYPGFKDAIAVVDVATPATYVRLTHVYKGSFEGFAPTPSALRTKIRKTVPGLKCFCICGQWTAAGGGLCTAVADGKKAAAIIKKEIR